MFPTLPKQCSRFRSIPLLGWLLDTLGDAVALAMGCATLHEKISESFSFGTEGSFKGFLPWSHIQMPFYVCMFLPSMVASRVFGTQVALSHNYSLSSSARAWNRDLIAQPR